MPNSKKQKYPSEVLKLSKKIKSLREKEKMTQQELADAADLDIRSIQRFESGKMIMRFTALVAIAEAFEMKPSELLKLIDL